MPPIPKPNPLFYFSSRSYPRFGRGPYSEQNPPKDVINSPYYWWYKFLQLNEDYATTAATHGGAGKYVSLYRDFGDVHSVDFKQWWGQHIHLFAEQPTKFSMRIAHNASQLAPFGNSDVVNLVVPLNWSKRGLKAAFNRHILKRVPDAPAGVHVQASDAKYRLSGKWNIDAMQAAYGLYTKRRAAKTAGQRLVLADAAIQLKLHLPSFPNIKKSDGDERRILTISACRHLRRAEKYIAAAASGKFPHLK